MRQAREGGRERGQDLVPDHRDRQAAPRRECRQRQVEVVQGLRARDHPEDPQRALTPAPASTWGGDPSDGDNRTDIPRRTPPRMWPTPESSGPIPPADVTPAAR